MEKCPACCVLIGRDRSTQKVGMEKDWVDPKINDPKQGDLGIKNALSRQPSGVNEGERKFSERTLDAQVDDPGLKKEGRERWPSRDPPSPLSTRDAQVTLSTIVQIVINYTRTVVRARGA
ncbi:hypothetical protein TNCV_2672261 [Trichonephila clavipes]|nr:hypothetical protein TNCV_2672261 [Trichonephila clavipes]